MMYPVMVVDNAPIQNMIHLRKPPCAAPIVQLMMLKYDPVTSCHRHLPTTGEYTIAILMDAHKMIATLMLMTLMTEMMTDLILK